jgi:hypothetical protein
VNRLGQIAILLGEHGVTDRALRLEIVSRAADRRVSSMKQFSADEAARVLRRLREAAEGGTLDEIIGVSAAYVEEQAAAG